MKYKREIIAAIFTFLSVMTLASCDRSSDQSNKASDTQSQKNHTQQNKNNDSSSANSTVSDSGIDNGRADHTEKGNHNENKTEDISNNVPGNEDNKSTADIEASLKEVYIKKLNDNKIDTEKWEPVDTSTYALKKVEDDRWISWDQLLNEIYGVLKESLATDEMDKLREEQRKWIEYRDNRALNASLKFKGRTLEHVEYVVVLGNLTKERCYELVEVYM